MTFKKIPSKYFYVACGVWLELALIGACIHDILWAFAAAAGFFCFGYAEKLHGQERSADTLLGEEINNGK